MDKNNERILIDAGLSEEQALVYESLVNKGPMKASTLSTWLGIKRGLMYKVLEQLESLGLVSKKGGSGTVAVFSPEHPSRLMDIVEQKAKSIALTKESLAFSLGSLASKFNLQSGKPNVQFFEGKDGIQKVLDDTLTSKTVIYSYADLESILDHIPKMNDAYSVEREKRKIKKMGILKDTPRVRTILKEYHTKITDTKLLAWENEGFDSVVQIYDGKISFITLTPSNIIGVIIEDKSIYEISKHMFEALWDRLPEFSNTISSPQR